MSVFGRLLGAIVPGGQAPRKAPAQGSPQAQPLAADAGLPALATGAILAPHADLLRRLKLAYGADQASFDAEILCLVHRYAEFVHLLPATPDNYFRARGGLLRLGLETGFLALQATDGCIFGGGTTITRRRHLEPRWRRATFIAGLCAEVHRTLSRVRVLDESGSEWPPYLEPLFAWLRHGRRERYCLTWRTGGQDMRALGLFALPHIVTPHVLQYLAQDNAIVVPQLMACVSGVPLYREPNVLERIVQRSLALVIDRDLARSADRLGTRERGAHLERYLLDAMRRLAAASSAWTVNGDKTRAWFAADGLYLVWPSAAHDIVVQLEAERIPGVPKAPEAILDILLDAGVLEPQADGTAAWTIRPPKGDRPLSAVKIRSPGVVLSALDPRPSPLPEALSTTPAFEPATPSPPTQLELIDAPVPRPVEDDTAGTGVQPPAHPERRAYCLRAPARLNPVVRSALSRVVDALNGDQATAAGYASPEGLFVPLTAFAENGIESAPVLRALADSGMLVVPAGAAVRTVTRSFKGTLASGILIRPEFVSGLAATAPDPAR